MKKLKQRMGIMLLIAVMLCVVTPITASAEESVETFEMIQASENVVSGQKSYLGLNNFSSNANVRTPMITSTYLNANPTAAGLVLTIRTFANEEANMIGVSDVVVEKKVGLGWQTVATSAGGYSTRTSMYSGTATVQNLEKGKTYRVSCTHYAYLSNGYNSVSNQTNEFVYSY